MRGMEKTNTKNEKELEKKTNKIHSFTGLILFIQMP